jgi:hypothetical protein
VIPDSIVHSRVSLESKLAQLSNEAGFTVLHSKQIIKKKVPKLVKGNKVICIILNGDLEMHQRTWSYKLWSKCEVIYNLRILILKTEWNSTNEENDILGNAKI